MRAILFWAENRLGGHRHRSPRSPFLDQRM